MNSVQLAQAIHVTRPTSPVILVTGHGELDISKEFDESRILQKAYSEDELVDKFKAALN
jgi:DNA-binding LytR/AlgR family response regulator